MIEASISLSSSSLVVAPVGFRPNSIFLGFQLEMDGLTQKLASPKRRALGTCAVLLWGPPGSGKSQIAREYLWRHRSEYPAGCFWVDCKTKASMSKSFWEIAQAVALLGDDPPRDPAWDESSKFVTAVRKWFESREGWLLVFDGVTTDNDDDIEALVPFIPDRTGNNIIYTSVDRTLAKRQRLLNPTGLKVFPLSQHDAVNLLYKNLGIKAPTEMQAKKALQLVRHYDCLPLAVHAAAHALLARGASLEKFSPGTSDYRLAEPYLDILATLRDNFHPEAVNLVTLLSFLDHRVPVALIRFGRPVLHEYGIETRSVEQIGSMKRELDNTIAVLIRYGLVERTLMEYSVPSPNRSASPEETRIRQVETYNTVEIEQREQRQLLKDDTSSLEGMIDTRPDSRQDESSSPSVTYSIDILRIHTVVQGVLRDELRFRHADQPAQYWWWLSVAARMLCHSYSVADGKIKSTEGRGLVRDYRDYETQAAKVFSHFPKHSADASPALRKTRHNLHETMRAIEQEIKNQSPSQSTDSLYRRVQFSVFERANSTSSDSDGQGTDSSLTRTSTWTPEHADNQTESPVQIHPSADWEEAISEGSWTDRWSQSGMDNSKILVPTAVQSRRPSDPEDHALAPTEGSLGSARSTSVMHLFQGRPHLTKTNELGEWRAVAIPPTLSSEQVHIKSRTSSFTTSSDDRTTRPTSTGSEASGALAAIHRASPPPARGGRIRSPSRSQCSRPTSEDARQPLAVKSPNQKFSPLAAEFQSGQSLPVDVPTTSRMQNRNPSSSPRLIQTALSNQAATRIVPPQSPNENFAPPRPVDTSLYSRSVPIHEISRHLSAVPLPTGASSQPMSRDSSRESNLSHATAPPAIPGSASLSSSPQIREPYLYSRPGPASIDVVALDEWGNMLPGQGAFEIESAPVTPTVDRRDIFERSHERLGNSVQFGDMSPVDFDQARARASLARDRSIDGRMERGERQPNR
jgi:hypothetical protein